VATVKFSRMITTIVTLLFLSRAFDLPLGAPRILLFFGTVLLLSFVVAGLPGRGPEVSLFPPYVAAGIPLDGVVLLEAVDAIPDIFKTILNVTGIMSAATILTPPPEGGAEQ
jgi:Na+/H+-dicarboxylate symporter